MKSFLLTTLCLAACVSAHASIVYFNGPSFTVPLDFTLVEPLDVDHNGVVDFNFSGGLGVSSGFGAEVSADVASVSGNAVLAQGQTAAALPAGSSIGPTVAGSAWSTNELDLAAYFITFQTVMLTPNGWVTNVPSSGWSGPLADAGSGFLGVKFQAADGTHYGWVHAALEDNVVVLDWAYETEPDSAIIAGAAPVVPVQPPAIIRPGNLRLQWPSHPGAAYQIQFKTALSAVGWSNLDFTFIATAAASAADVPITGTAAFYRVVESK